MIKKCVVFNLTSSGTLKNDYAIKTLEMFNFLPLVNNSVTVYASFLDCILQYFHKSLAYHLSIQ